MAKYYSPQNIPGLTVPQKYANSLDIESFSLMMKDPSYCYKFYWLEALTLLISEGKTETTFDDAINEMIANAWYSVREFHIHLSGMQNGKIRDGLERAILLLADISSLPANASKAEIKNSIKKFDKELKASKEQLTNMVPYRALSGFFYRTDEVANWSSVVQMVEYINRVNNTVVTLPYTLGKKSKLKKEIFFNSEWSKMIQDNTVPILGWIQYEKVKWLQMNNPEVPSLIYKLTPLDEKARKLHHVRNLWNCILDLSPIQDVFTDKPIQKSEYDVDHFIPWSFVMNDELWNLMPMDSSLNSSKSNHLPRWDPFFVRFAENQFSLYKLIHQSPSIHRLYEACFRDNLHSIWATQELYRPGNTKEEFFNILQNNMQPVYNSARRQGYDLWSF